MHRITRIVGSLLITLACYVAYAAAIVPWIEPPSENVRVLSITKEEEERIREAQERQRRELAYWFSPGDWELDSPKTVQTNQCRLLFNDNRDLGGGLVELKPCSLVFLSADLKNDSEQQKRRAFVLRAPQGAILRFDAPIDWKQISNIGKLIGGELLGEVHILSGQRLPGPEDDVAITTRDVQLTEKQITTPHLMEFRMGRHRGRGRGVVIDLEQAGAAAGAQAEIRGFRALTLQEQVYVRLAPDSGDDFFPGSSQKPAATSGKNGSEPRSPVEIRCSGPFTFDETQNVAVFRNAVDVLRVNPGAESDHLNGDVLTVYFESATPSPPSTPPTPGTSRKRLDARRVEVAGTPVVIRAPSNGMTARAQFVEHDVVTRSVRLRDAVEAIVRQTEREVRAPELFFQPEPEGDYGTFLATGRGSLTSSSPDGGGETYEAQWEKTFHFRRHEGQFVLTADGAARLASAEKGSLTATQIHVWFRETPRAPQSGPPTFAFSGAKGGGPSQNKRKTELLVDRMLAVGDVHIESPEATGDVLRMEAWFEHTGAGAQVRQTSYRPELLAAAMLADVVAQEPLPFPRLPMTPPAENLPPHAPASEGDGPPSPFVAPPLVAPAVVGPDAQPPQSTMATRPKYDLHGELLRLRVGVENRRTLVREAVLERGVRLTEAQVENADQQPLLIQGDRLHLTQPTPERSHVTVVGAPAYVEARGMTMSGGKLVLDRPDPRTNVVSVDGQGVMTMPVERDLQGNPTAAPERLQLTWQGRLDFDGLTARFQRGVEARLSNQYLRTDRLEATFSEPVRLGESNSSGNPEMRKIDCYEGVYLEARTVEAGRLRAVERLQCRDLSVDRPTGDVAASGPGELWSVRRGNAGKSSVSGLAGPTGVGVAPQSSAAAPGAGDAETIQYMHVAFQRNLSGNEKRREMAFFNDVSVIHGPIPDWNSVIDPDQPETWIGDTVMIDCDRLQVNAIVDPTTGKDAVDMVAEGNTLVEGKTFTSRSPRVTYAQEKDLLVIEGDARTDAVLYHQKRNGATPAETKAKRFMVWPKTNRVQVDGATFLELR